MLKSRWGLDQNNTMAHLAFNKSGILCGYAPDGEGPVFKWTYSTFEHFLNEPVTPSMYNYMAGWVYENFTASDRVKLAELDYASGELEADAVDAYFGERINERITMHEQELVNLRAAKRLAEARESAAIDAMLEENKPFDHTSPIDHEYSDFMRGIIAKARKDIDRLECEIHEEEQWRGGHEEGAENDDHLNMYDPMEY